LRTNLLCRTQSFSEHREPWKDPAAETPMKKSNSLDKLDPEGDIDEERIIDVAEDLVDWYQAEKEKERKNKEKEEHEALMYETASETLRERFSELTLDSFMTAPNNSSEGEQTFVISSDHESLFDAAAPEPKEEKQEQQSPIVQQQPQSSGLATGEMPGGIVSPDFEIKPRQRYWHLTPGLREEDVSVKSLLYDKYAYCPSCKMHGHEYEFCPSNPEGKIMEVYNISPISLRTPPGSTRPGDTDEEGKQMDPQSETQSLPQATSSTSQQPLPRENNRWNNLMAKAADPTAAKNREEDGVSQISRMSSASKQIILSMQEQLKESAEREKAAAKRERDLMQMMADMRLEMQAHRQAQTNSTSGTGTVRQPAPPPIASNNGENLGNQRQPTHQPQFNGGGGNIGDDYPDDNHYGNDQTLG
jgi:hypothetical protein